MNGSGGGSTCSLETTDAQSRGWLGQESLAKSGICIKNLNARLYDPLTASFASADTVVGHPFSTQGWNRYAYGGNNPLTNADPTGMCFGGCFWKQPLFRDVVGIAVAFALDNPEWGVLALDGFATGSAFNVGIAGAASGAVSTGTLKGTLISLAEANSFDSIGDIKEVLTLQNGSLGSILMHGTAGGLFSMAQGGKFQSGFLAAGFAELAGPVVDDITRGNIYVGTAASAVTGVLGSVLGGGKFENGAVTGAYGYLFNGAAHPETQPASAFASVGGIGLMAGGIALDVGGVLAAPFTDGSSLGLDVIGTGMFEAGETALFNRPNHRRTRSRVKRGFFRSSTLSVKSSACPEFRQFQS